MNDNLSKILGVLVQIREQLTQTNESLREIARAGERAELGQILRGLKARGVITQEDVERVEAGQT